MGSWKTLLTLMAFGFAACAQQSVEHRHYPQLSHHDKVNAFAVIVQAKIAQHSKFPLHSTIGLLTEELTPDGRGRQSAGVEHDIASRFPQYRFIFPREYPMSGDVHGLLIFLDSSDDSSLYFTVRDDAQQDDARLTKIDGQWKLTGVRNFL
jgi:hypothetical protein